MKYKIIENTDEARKKFGYNYGADHIKITKTDLKELKNGKCFATGINGNEYSFFLSVNPFKGE